MLSKMIDYLMKEVDNHFEDYYYFNENNEVCCKICGLPEKVFEKEYWESTSVIITPHYEDCFEKVFGYSLNEKFEDSTKRWFKVMMLQQKDNKSNKGIVQI